MVVVTGATGFIGRRLVTSLVADNMEVCIVTRQEIEQSSLPEPVSVIRGDITKEFVIPEGVSTIYHCAGSFNEKADMEKVNISATRNVAAKAIYKGCRLVYLSSAGVVGKQKNGVIDEKVECKPDTKYERSKYHAEQIIIEHVRAGLNAQILRPTIVFGAGRDAGEDSFYQLVMAIRSGLYVNINKGRGIYNIVHKDEVVRAMRILGEEDLPSGGSFFLNTPITFDEFSSVVKAHHSNNKEKIRNVPYFPSLCMAAFFSVMSKLTRKRMPFSLSRFRTLTNGTIFSSALISEVAGYFPARDVKEYIRKTCDEYEQIAN